MDLPCSAFGDAALLSRLIRPERADLPPDAARAILKLDFDETDRARMHELALQAQAGDLNDVRIPELESYRRVGRLLDLMHSKARQSLNKTTSAA